MLGRSFIEVGDDVMDDVERALRADLRDRARLGVSHPRGGFNSRRFVDLIDVHNDRMRLIDEARD